MKHIKEIWALSLLQALGAGIVVWLWSLVMINGEHWFNGTPPSALSFVTVPLIFIVTATLSAGAVLGYPLYLAFHQKNWPKAVALLGLTIVWLILISTVLVFTAIR